MNDTMDGEIAIVTGAGNGIGRAIAGELARCGATVAVLDVDADGAGVTVEAIVGAGGRAVAVAVDLLDSAAIEGAVAEVAGAFGRVDVLVNNAGLMDGMLTIETVTLEQWNRVMGVNVTAPFLLCKAVVPLMLEHGHGSIVNVASIAALTGGRAGTAYTSSKHALIGLTRSLAWTYAPQGLRCNAVCPGGTKTDIRTRELKGEPDELGAERFRMAGPLAPRRGEPDEIASAVRYLASPEASFVNGTVLVADGGMTAC